MPRNMDDASDRCPGFDSVELLEDGNREPVTTLSYQRFKFQLYRIASPITRDVYFNKRSTVQDIIKRVQDINQRLVEWERSVPLELRPSSFSAQASPDPITKIFQLQALALQLSYDNIQLILHRPLLVHNGIIHTRRLSSRRTGHTASDYNENGESRILDQETDFLSASKARCWQSARRTSCIDEQPEILKQARNSHAAGYAGIQTFTAGVMLGIFALSHPFSAQAQEAKRGIGRLIKVPKLLGYRTAISDQSGRILEELLRLILAEEMKMLISEEETTTGRLQSDQVVGPSTTRSAIQKSLTQTGAPSTGSISAPSLSAPPAVDSINISHLSSTTDALLYAVPSTNGNFNDARQSLQQGKHPFLTRANISLISPFFQLSATMEEIMKGAGTLPRNTPVATCHGDTTRRTAAQERRCSIRPYADRFPAATSWGVSMKRVKVGYGMTLSNSHDCMMEALPPRSRVGTRSLPQVGCFAHLEGLKNPSTLPATL